MPEYTGDCPRCQVQELVSKGCKVIFTITGYLQEACEIAEAHPEIEFCTNAADYRGSNIATYAIRSIRPVIWPESRYWHQDENRGYRLWAAVMNSDKL